MNKDVMVAGWRGNNVRMFNFNGDTWWALKDVCNVLGIQNVTDTANRLDDDEKLIRPDLTSLGQRGGWLVNEAGLYSVILRSDKSFANDFKRWITHDVLKHIRAYGYYIMPGDHSGLGEARHDLLENELVRLFSYTKNPIRKEVSEMHPNGVDVVRFDLVYSDSRNYCIFDIKTGFLTSETVIETLVKGYMETIIKKGGKRKCFLYFVGPGCRAGGYNAIQAAQKAKHINFKYATYQGLYNKVCEKIENDHKDRIKYMPNVIKELISPVNFPYISGIKKMPELTAV